MVDGLATSVGLLVGHIAMMESHGESTIGPRIVVALAVLVVLNEIAPTVRARPTFPEAVAA